MYLYPTHQNSKNKNLNTQTRELCKLLHPADHFGKNSNFTNFLKILELNYGGFLSNISEIVCQQGRQRYYKIMPGIWYYLLILKFYFTHIIKVGYMTPVCAELQIVERKWSSYNERTTRRWSTFGDAGLVSPA